MAYPYRVGAAVQTPVLHLWRAPIIDLAGIVAWWGPRALSETTAEAKAARDLRRARRQGTL
jgi:hypothetical protein